MDSTNHSPAPTQTTGLLLQQARYTINYYQRQYVWEDIHIADLMTDLLGEFRRNYSPKHVRKDVASYGMYFLGPINLMKVDAAFEIIDGQQRITSLILLIIALHHRLAQENPAITSALKSHVYNERYGDIEFVLQAPDRQECLEGLLESGHYTSNNLTVSNARIVHAYEQIASYLADLNSHAVTLFSDWVVHRTYVLSIETEQGRDAHTIYLTMNDRGQRLDDDEKMKAFLLSALPSNADRDMYNTRWQSTMDRLDTFIADDDYFPHRHAARKL